MLGSCVASLSHHDAGVTLGGMETDKSAEAGLCTVDLGVGGMTCASCVARVERALKKVPGVQEAAINLATESARIVAVGDDQLPARLMRAVRDAGYEPRVKVDGETLTESASAWEGFAPVAAGLALSLPLVLPMMGDLWGQHWMLSAWLQFLLATPVQFVLGARFYRAGWGAAKALSGNMDLLVAIGTSAGWALSVWLWLSAGPGEMVHLYFEGSAMVVTLVLLGKWLEARAKRQTTAAIRALHSLRPTTARWLGPDGETQIAIGELLVGDRIVVLPGERIAADGVVVQGQTQVDESMLTGESLPVGKGEGDALTAGSLNGGGRVVLQVSAVGAETVLAHIIRLVEDAQAAKAPIQRLVDQVAAVFVPVVLVIAAATLVGWWLTGHSFETAVISAVAVLVIACPCALGLATPAAIMAGTGVAAQHGVLIKDAQALEVAHKVDVLAFDKTGTLTVGKPRLTGLTVADAAGPDAMQLLAIAASLQSGSEHPLALAVLTEAKLRGVVWPQPQDVQALPGRGVQALVDGRRYGLGSLAWATSLAADVVGGGASVSALQADGATVSALLAWHGESVRLLALLAFADEPKPGAREALDRLRARGLRVVMVSGDNRAAAQAMALRLGFDASGQDVLAEVLPADKARRVAELRQGGHTVAMVGDGVNDAPALAAADVGLAMGSGTDVAMHAAGITLMRGDLALVEAALDISSRTVAKIRQNLFWAFFYNVVGIPLAALGYLNPVLAGAAMAMSSVSVMSNALLLKRWRPGR